MKVLICLDFSEATERVLQAARLLLGTRVPQAQIDVLFVLDTRLLAATGTEQQTEAALREQSASIFSMAKDYLGAGIRFTEEYGIPQPKIDEVLERTPYDLVVTGTRGRSTLTGVLLGSVAEHLLHHAHRPLLIVP